jgi:hypothetical protein
MCSQTEQLKNRGLTAVNQIVQLMNEIDVLKDQKEELVHQIEAITEDNLDTAATCVLRSDLIIALEAKEAAISHL